MLASAVLVMESFTLGFALLLAMKNHSSGAIIYGASIAILLILSAGFLKSKSGWIFASALQIAMLAFGFASECQYCMRVDESVFLVVSLVNLV